MEITKLKLLSIALIPILISTVGTFLYVMVRLSWHAGKSIAKHVPVSGNSESHGSKLNILIVVLIAIILLSPIVINIKIG